MRDRNTSLDQAISSCREQDLASQILSPSYSFLENARVLLSKLDRISTGQHSSRHSPIEETEGFGTSPAITMDESTTEVWLARDLGNWKGVYVTRKKPTWSRNSLWSMQDVGFEISPTAFERTFGWLPTPGTLHRVEINMLVLESLSAVGDS